MDKDLNKDELVLATLRLGRAQLAQRVIVRPRGAIICE